jgi:hypothetical protein
MAYMKTTPAGLSAYQKTPVNWSWLYYPPPYAFADPAKIPPPAGVFYADAHEMGMAGCNCGGSCGGCSRGVGSIADLSTPAIVLGVSVAIAATVAYFSKGTRRR